LYAKSLGANDFIVGVYLAFSYLCLALGVLSSGYVVGKKVSRKRLIIYAGVACLPLTWLMGWVNSVALLIPITSLSWFLGGIAFSALNTLASDLTAASSRGTFFSLFAMASALGAIIGGLISGPVVDQWGYQTLFSIMTLVTLLWPLSICLLDISPDHDSLVNNAEVNNLQENIRTDLINQTRQNYNRNERPALVNTNIKWLLLATLADFTANFMGTLGISLSMDQLGFNATEITSTAVVGGLISLPFVYGIGRLSDLFGRKKLWLVCSVSGLFYGVSSRWVLKLPNQIHEAVREGQQK
jgi:MFS family permease